MVHKVSAHRVLKLLTAMNLIDVGKGGNGRYRYFAISPSKKPRIQRLVQAAMTEIQIGRPLTSVIVNVESTIQNALEARDLKISRSPKVPYDLIYETERLRVGVELLTFPQPRLHFRRKFNELIGSICINASEFPFVVVVVLGADDKDLIEESYALESRLRKANIALKFLWVAKRPLEINSNIINEEIVEPLVRLLRDWERDLESPPHTSC
jgi:hypothetical protein